MSEVKSKTTTDWLAEVSFSGLRHDGILPGHAEASVLQSGLIACAFSNKLQLGDFLKRWHADSFDNFKIN